MSITLDSIGAEERSQRNQISIHTNASVAIDESYTIVKKPIHITEIRVSADTAPVEVENVTIKLVSALGTAYDITLYDSDISGATSTIQQIVEAGLVGGVGDRIDVDYDNTDLNLIGVQVLGYQELGAK